MLMNSAGSAIPKARLVVLLLNVSLTTAEPRP